MLTAQQKVLLHEQFFTTNQMGQKVQKSFGLESLQEASSVFKKLLQDVEELKEGDNIVGFQFKDSEVEFTADETVFIRKLLEGIKEATPNHYEVLLALKEMFKK